MRSLIERLETKQSRRLFYFLIFLALFAIFAIQYLLIPYIMDKPVSLDIEVVESILEMLFTSIVVTVLLAVFFVWLLPKKVENSEIKVLQPYEIKKYFAEARLNTREWWFHGGSGRYTRNVTLPYLANVCRNENTSINVFINIMNPDNSKICEKYAKYRNGLRTADTNNKRTASNVQLDLIATIISAFIQKEQQPLLNIQIGLKDFFSLFRIDLSDNMVLITREDPNEPAIVYKKGNFFYDAYKNDLVQVFKQFNQVTMTHNFVSEENLNKDNIQDLITKLNLKIKLDDKDIEQIIILVTDKSTPYNK